MLDAKPSVKVAAVLRKIGRPKAGTNVDNINISSGGGTDPAYLAARLRRDHPEADFDESVRGSVRQAAIAAGIVKVPSVLDKLRTLWAKATEAERDARAAGRGLWADKAPVAPWEWRAGEKGRKGQPAAR